MTTHTKNEKYSLELRKSEPEWQFPDWITLRETKAFGGSVMMNLEDAKDVVLKLQEAINYLEGDDGQS